MYIRLLPTCTECDHVRPLFMTKDVDRAGLLDGCQGGWLEAYVDSDRRLTACICGNGCSSTARGSVAESAWVHVSVTWVPGNAYENTIDRLDFSINGGRAAAGASGRNDYPTASTRVITAASNRINLAHVSCDASGATAYRSGSTTPGTTSTSCCRNGSSSARHCTRSSSARDRGVWPARPAACSALASIWHR